MTQRPRRQILTPILLPILAAGLLVQATVPLARILTTYSALEAGFGPKVIGLLSAAFAILPVFLTVLLGRFNDRGGARGAAMAGSIGLLIACLALWLLPPSLFGLLAATALLGIAQTLVLASMQLMISRSSSRMHRDAVLGNYMVAVSLGQALGPLFLGVADGRPHGAAIPVLGAALLVVAMLQLIRVSPSRKRDGDRAEIPLSEIAATPGLPWLIILGSICVASQDLILAFLPLLGVERGIAPAAIGILLSLRAGAAMVSRICFSRAVRLLGRGRLLLAATLMGGLGLLGISLPLPVWGLAVALALTGFGVGIALTSTVSLTMVIAPPAARGTALSLRLTANRIAQFTIPIIAGVAVGSFGAAGVLGVSGAALMTATLMAPRAFRQKKF
ncbi:MFS transporter [Haematobacter massiliensis]|uniref:MFS transporter n=1 Tax=Haematobacter massiliensis TaxID=195105 RepID=UPI000552A9B6|nr:MFS transporter [Haematobacter massiliensis]OWJ73026.1 MFS transporter [Haematobacter massiliensis]OWJ88304.1 MFS transporter [Haematobacter massiliensis]QBJ25661.1 MFS transporter [Haematobacter massiliensis]